MPIKLRRSEHFAISEDGLYLATVAELLECTTKKGETKVVLTLQPRNIETGEEYRKIETWLDTDGDLDARVNSLLDALPSQCEVDLEKAVGLDVGIVVNINVEKKPAYINIVNFFDIDEDFVTKDEDDDEDDDLTDEDDDEDDDLTDDDDDEDDDLTDDEDDDFTNDDDLTDDDDDDFVMEEKTEVKHSKIERKSPPRRENQRR